MSARSLKETAHAEEDHTKPTHRTRWVLAALLVLAGLGGGAGWLLRRPASPLADASLAYAQGDWDRSASLARARLRTMPGDGEAHRLSARSLARLNRDQQAITVYSGLDIRQMVAEDYFLLGRALSRTGQDELAHKALETSRSTEPERPEMLDELAQVSFRTDRLAAAAEIAEALARRPDWEARAQFLLGTFRASLNDTAGSATALRRGFAIDPEGKSIAPQPANSLRLLLVRSLLGIHEHADALRQLRSMPDAATDAEMAWLESRALIQGKAWKEADPLLGAAASYRHDHLLEPEPAAYTGASRCTPCHRSIAETHLACRHSTTFGYAREPGQFPIPAAPLLDPADPRVAHRFERSDEQLNVETRVQEKVFRAVAQYAFGSPDHFVTVIGPDDHDQLRELRISYFDSPRGKGWDISTGLERLPREASDFLGPALDSREGRRRCLSCHTTNFRSIERGVGPESADHSIGCETCHGPGGNHLLAVEGQLSDRAIVSPSRDNVAAINQLCGRCHSGTEPRDFSGDPDDPGWYRFQVARLEKSRCFVESGGRISCVTCHDPHANAEKAPGTYEATCLSCHDSGKTVCPVNSTKGCVSCHMPRAWHEATHSFKSDHRIRTQHPPGPQG